MKLLVAFSAVLALGLGSNLRYDELKFAQFKEQFGKQYQTRSDIIFFYQGRNRILTPGLST